MSAVFAYVVVSVDIQKPKELRLPGGYDPGVKIGDVLMLTAAAGPVNRWVDNDGPVSIHTVAVRVGEGEADGEDVTFDVPVKRTLALLQIGAEGQRAITEQVTAALDAVEEQILNGDEVVPLAVAKFRLAEIRKSFLR